MEQNSQPRNALEQQEGSSGFQHDPLSLSSRFSKECLTGEDRNFISAALNCEGLDLDLQVCSMSVVSFDADGQDNPGSFFEDMKEEQRKGISFALLDVLNAASSSEKEIASKVLAKLF